MYLFIAWQKFQYQIVMVQALIIIITVFPLI